MTIKAINYLCAILLILCSTAAYAQRDTLQQYPGAYVNFNVRPSPISNPTPHEVSLYGCNTEITTTATIGDLQWNQDNQVLPGVPYGPQKDGGKNYFVSKYYMASTPVFNAPPSDTDVPVIIGLVIPDQFTFSGNRPVQIVNLNYSILEEVYLSYSNVDYYYSDGQEPSCADLGVDLIPLNLSCDDFGWSNTELLPGAQGASGIAFIRNDTVKHLNRIFLPSNELGKEYLNCEVSILDDIMLHHEIFFETEEGRTKSLDLTAFYTTHPKTEQIKLYCKARAIEDIPAGCQDPTKAISPIETQGKE